MPNAFVQHAIADGLGLANMLQHMVELSPDDRADDEVPAPSLSTAVTSTHATRRSVSHRMSEEAKTSVRVGRSTIRSTVGFLRDPIGTARDAVRTSSSVASVVKPAIHPLSPLMTARSMTPVFRTMTIPLDRLRAAARPSNATINDAFVSSVLDGVDRYHRSLDAACDKIRMSMQISVRTDERAAVASNQFVPARVELPLGQRPPADRLVDTQQRLRALKEEPALPTSASTSTP